MSFAVTPTLLVGQSEKWLKEEGNVGDYIFRPSRSNKDKLTISWLFTDGVFKHLPVKVCVFRDWLSE
jgi:hypothetical protein